MRAEHTSRTGSLDLNIEAGGPRVSPAGVITGILVLSAEALIPSPNPDHIVYSVLNIVRERQVEVVGLLIHGISSDESNGISAEVGLSTLQPVGLGEVGLVFELGVLLTSPVDTDETRVTVVGGTNVPA